MISVQGITRCITQYGFFPHIIVFKFSGLMAELISVSQFEVSGIAGKIETRGLVDMTHTMSI